MSQMTLQQKNFLEINPALSEEIALEGTELQSYAPGDVPTEMIQESVTEKYGFKYWKWLLKCHVVCS